MNRPRFLTAEPKNEKNKKIKNTQKSCGRKMNVHIDIQKDLELTGAVYFSGKQKVMY